MGTTGLLTALAAVGANALGKPNLDTETALDRALLRADCASGPAASPRPGRPNSFLDWARGALPVPAWPTIAGNGGKVKVEGSVIACPFTK